MGEWDFFEPYHLNVCGFHAYCGAFTGAKIRTHSTNKYPSLKHYLKLTQTVSFHYDSYNTSFNDQAQEKSHSIIDHHAIPCNISHIMGFTRHAGNAQLPNPK